MKQMPFVQQKKNVLLFNFKLFFSLIILYDNIIYYVSTFIYLEHLYYDEKYCVILKYYWLSTIFSLLI